jgi:hypothetical protein
MGEKNHFLSKTCTLKMFLYTLIIKCTHLAINNQALTVLIIIKKRREKDYKTLVDNSVKEKLWLIINYTTQY